MRPMSRTMGESCSGVAVAGETKANPMALPKMRMAGEDGRPIPKRVGLTKTFIQRQACPTGKREIVVYDSDVNGLCVYVTPTAKSFYLYRKWRGRPLKMKLGRFPELSVDNARKLAMKHLGQMVQGVDPREERHAIRQSATLQELYDRWDKEFATPRYSPKTLRTDKSRFDTCFADWKGRKIATIREHDVRTKHTELATKCGQVTANRAVQLLRRLFNFGRIKPNPASNREGKVVDFFYERTRERFLPPRNFPDSSRRWILSPTPRSRISSTSRCSPAPADPTLSRCAGMSSTSPAARGLSPARR